MSEKPPVDGKKALAEMLERACPGKRFIMLERDESDHIKPPNADEPHQWSNPPASATTSPDGSFLTICYEENGRKMEARVVPKEPVEDGDVFSSVGARTGLWRGDRQIPCTMHVKAVEDDAPDLSPDAVEALTPEDQKTYREMDAARKALLNGADKIEELSAECRALSAALTAANARADAAEARAARMEGELAALINRTPFFASREGDFKAWMDENAASFYPAPRDRPVNPEDGGDGA